MHPAPLVVGAALAIASVANVARHKGPRAPRIWGWIFVAGLFVVAVGLVGCAGGSFVDAPPTQFRGPGFYAVRTVPTAQIASVCAGVSMVGERQGHVVGCTKGAVIILPNPAEWSDPYAQLFAHEAGHRLGWADTHPR